MKSCEALYIDIPEADQYIVCTCYPECSLKPVNAFIVYFPETAFAGAQDDQVEMIKRKIRDLIRSQYTIICSNIFLSVLSSVF